MRGQPVPSCEVQTIARPPAAIPTATSPPLKLAIAVIRRRMMPKASSSWGTRSQVTPSEEIHTAATSEPLKAADPTAQKRSPTATTSDIAGYAGLPKRLSSCGTLVHVSPSGENQTAARPPSHDTMHRLIASGFWRRLVEYRGPFYSVRRHPHRRIPPPRIVSLAAV